MEIIKHKDWDYLNRQYDWVANMHGVPQSPIHHAEGDVAIHTQMVLKALVELNEYQLLNAEAKEIIWMAALLHDVEKRSTTIEIDGNIESPGHAKKGASTARQILFIQFNIPFESREQIVHLVRYHGLPIWLMDKENPQKALLEAAFHVNTTWLSMLAKADMLGRICADQQEMLDKIDFFIAYCQEQNCWGTAPVFKTGLAKFEFFYKENVDVNYVPFDNTICEVILLSGLPGMGKDNFIKKNYSDLPVISLDEIRRLNKLKPTDKSANGWVSQEAKEQARVYLRAKKSFIWNATNITLQMRSQLIDLFTSYGARTKIVYIEKPYSLWQKQNVNREFIVPKNVLDKLLFKLEIPKQSEAHLVEYIVE